MRRQHHKGNRSPIPVYGPPAHKDFYTKCAAALGLPAGDYAALVLARVHALPDPAYVPVGIELQASKQDDDQLALFISRLPDPDRVPKPDRVPWSVRVPVEHRQCYEDLAGRAGIPLGSYVVLAMAQAHGLNVPRYLRAPAGVGPGRLRSRRHAKSTSAA